MRLRKFIFLMCMVFSLCAHANDELSVAIDAYERGNYQLAFEHFSNLADQNVPEAQYNLAFMYFGGDGIEQNDEKAAYWFKQAAQAGHAAAQDTLAYMYLNGRGLKPDRVRAYAWYSVAADNGIFLARNISENLKKNMGPAERIEAEMLSREYLKKFRK